MAEWCTIESDPGVFTELIKNIGVKGIQVEEILDMDLLEQNNEPVYGLIFLFKYIPNSGYSPNVLTNYDGDLYFAKQIITNACATQAILAILMNNEDKIDIGPTLKELKSFSKEMDPQMKGLTISNSDKIKVEHNKFARPEPFVFTQSREATDKDDVFHFVGYVHFKNKIYEIDGLRQGPILIEDNCKFDEWIQKVKPSILKRIELYAGNEIKFNLMAVVPNRLDKAIDLDKQLNLQINYINNLINGGDMDMTNSLLQSFNNLSKEDLNKKKTELESLIITNKLIIDEESEKVKNYKIENTRRQHNYIPFIFKMLSLMSEKNMLQEFYDEAKANEQKAYDEKMNKKNKK